MKLGLIGPGQHGKRYLEPKNGGERFVATLRRGEDIFTFLKAVDGVVIATPPDQHRQLAELALAAGKKVLIEKPLCGARYHDIHVLVHQAACKGLWESFEPNPEEEPRLWVAHTHYFDAAWNPPRKQVRHIEGTFVGPTNGHTWSALLDWGPHALALAFDAAQHWRTDNSSRCVLTRGYWLDGETTVYNQWTITQQWSDYQHAQGDRPTSHLTVGSAHEKTIALKVEYQDGEVWEYRPDESAQETPMLRMVKAFCGETEPLPRLNPITNPWWIQSIYSRLSYVNEK